MSDNAFTCRTDVPEVAGLTGGEITVGREFTLSCTGPWPEFHEGLALSAQLPETSKYAVRILDSKRTASDTYELKITTYQASPVNIENLVVTDGQVKAELGPVSFEVKSVLDPQQPQQEPYPPLGPLGIPVPLSWWITLAVVLAVLFFVSLRAWRRRWQRRRLLEKIREHDSALSPLAEFHQQLRRMQRHSPVFAGEKAETNECREVVQELEKMFRVFLMRRFLLPVFEWNDTLLLKEFRHEHHELFEEKGRDLKALLKEFAAARKSSQVQARDALQLSEQTRSLAEFLDLRAGV